MRVLAEKSAANDGLGKQHGVVEQLGPILTIILIGALAEAAVPWLTMWLSDILLFDIPRRATWLLFAAPLIVTVCLAAGYYIVKARSIRNVDREAVEPATSYYGGN